MHLTGSNKTETGREQTNAVDIKKESAPTSLRVVAGYFIFGVLWILLSDNILLFFVPSSSATYVLIQSLKGWLFVSLSALLIYLILKKDIQVLETNEAYLRSILNAAPDAMLILKNGGGIVLANQQVRDIFGYEPEELIGQGVDFLMPERFRTNHRRYQTEFFNAPRHRTDPRQTLYGLHENGHEFPVSITLNHQTIGGSLYIIASIRDITEWKLAEEVVRESQGLYQELFESNPQPMWVYDLETLAFLMVNDAAVGHYGYTREEFLGMTIKDIRPEEEIPALMENLAKPPQKLERSTGWRHRKKDGSLIDVDISSHALQFNGKPARLVMANDVTERKQAEDSLRNSEENYRSLAETSDSAICVLDRDGMILYANPASIRIWNDPQLAGRTVHDLFPAEAAERYLAAIHRVIDHQVVDLNELEAHIKGRVMWFRASMTPIKNADGSVNALLLNAWDITERKQSEEALRRNERVLRLFVEHSPAAIAMFDRDMRYIVHSRRFVADYQLPDQDLTGRLHYEVFPEIPERIKDIHRRCLAGNIERAEEEPFPRADGRLDYVHWEMHPWYEETGKVGGLILFSEVVTERVTAREELAARHRDMVEIARELEESHTMLELIIESAPVRVFWKDIQSRYLGCNSLFARDTGFDNPGEIVGKLDEEFVWKENAQAFRQEEREIIETGVPIVNQVKAQAAPGGGTMWVNVSVAPLKDADGRVIGTMGIYEDITERRLAVEALRESEARFRALFEDVPIAIWEQDFSEVKKHLDSLKAAGVTDFRAYFDEHPEELLYCEGLVAILDVNQTGVRMYDAKDKQELIQATMRDTSRGELENGAGEMTAIAEGRTSNSWEGSDETLAGKPIDIRVNWSVVPGYEKDYSRVIVTTLDITERKQAEMARERLLNVLEASLNEIYIFDPDDLKFEYVNSGARLNLGYSLEELKTMTPIDLKPQFTEASFREIIAPLFRGEKHFLNFETIHRRADGSLYPVEIHLQLVETGEERAYLAVINDITQRKQAEAVLTQRLAELELLYQSGLALNSELEPKQVAGKLIEALETKMDWHHIAIRRYDSHNDRLEVLAFRQPSLENETQEQAVEERFNEAVSNSSQGLSGWVARHGQTVRAGDVRADARYTETYPGIGSGLYAPMTLGERVVGVISVESTQLNAFNESDERLLKTVANQAAVAFENASLFQDLQRELIERIQAEKALGESEERFSTAFFTSPVSQSIIAQGTNEIMAVNDACCRLFEYSRDELIGARTMKLNLWEDPTERLSAVEELQRTGRLLPREATIRTKSGGIHTVIVEIAPIMWKGIPSLISTIFDITERKKAEQALKASEERMRLTLQTTSDGFWIIDQEGAFLEVNNAYCEMSGYSRAELLQMRIPDLEVIESIEDIRSHIARVESERHERFETRHRRKDGSEFDVEFTVNLLDEQSGQLICFCRDITERKRGERETRQRTQDLALVNTLNEAANRGEPIETIINLFIQEAYSVFDCRDAAIYLISPDGKYLDMQTNSLPRELRGQIEDFIGITIPKIRLPIREGSHTQYLLSRTEGTLADDPAEIQKWVLEFTETTFLPDVLRAPIRTIIPRIINLLGVHSTITIPLVSSGQTIGLMDFSSSNRFTVEDMERLLLISRQMTAILMRKQAEANIETHLKRITALNEIDRAIGSSLDIRLSLEVLLKEVVSQLGVDAADVLLMNPVDSSLEYILGRGFRTSGIRQTREVLGQGLAGKAGLEQKALHIPDLKAVGREFNRAELLKGEEFVEYFGVPLLAKGALKGVLEIFNRTSRLPDPDWITYLETLGGQASIAIDSAESFATIQRSNQELMSAYDATIAGWSHAMDLRDEETEGHSQRVTELTLRLAKRMGVSQQDQIHMRRGALLHDIGKLGVPDQILLKPGKLTEEEWGIMHKHPTYAYEMLLPIAYLEPALDIPYCHHEKWDGTGYPRGLKGEQIPLAARIFAVVDVWDALRSDRPYRPGWELDRIREYIRAESGKHFEPRVAEAFLKMLEGSPEMQ